MDGKNLKRNSQNFNENLFQNQKNLIFNYNMRKDKFNILHLLKISFPKVSGYNVRSHYILKKQKKFANPFALTSPFFRRENKIEIIEGVKYYRYPKGTKVSLLNHPWLLDYLIPAKLINRLYFDGLKIPIPFLEKLVREKNIHLIHGHTNQRFSRYGQMIAKKLGIPFIYEVRGFWEDSLVIQTNLKALGYQYFKIRRKETKLMKKADAIITLGHMMKNEIVSRKISKKKIYIIPNAVDTNLFKPIPANKMIIQKLKLENKIVIAYIGSIRKLEGIEILIKAFKEVRRKKKEIVLLLIGPINKNYKRILLKLIEKLKIGKDVKFIGSVNPSFIRDFYSIVDICVIPRIKTRVSSLVTPLKQLEAMAMEKCVITSDLPALKEIIKPNKSGDLFNVGNYRDLAKKLIFYITNHKKRDELGKSARNYVKENYDWDIVIQKYKKIYEKLIN